ncbi:MAG: type II toxin-antitoxin system prevent-host-death family antitoxin [Verrucomicrobia bacterium]|nr:type II toxin-antitoxin system prevent-host-death family antitoxin [Verrucomicrobiota bacterium]
MNSTYSVSAARAKFPAMVRSAQAGRLVGVTKNNETVAFLISRERLEALIETKELLANPAFVQAWTEEKAGKGKYHPASALAD